METEEESSGPPRGLLLSLGVVGILLGAAVAGLFVFRLQPQLGGSPVSVAAGVSSVLIPSNAASENFKPENTTVLIGVNNTVQWTDQDTVPHTVVVCKAGGGQLCLPSAAVASSRILSKGDVFKVKFNSTGVYDYYCSVHPSTMRASVIVKGGATVDIPSGTAAQSLNYSPASFTVVIGVNNTVTFVNKDSTTHTVTSDNGESLTFDSGDILVGRSWAFTFATPGTYAFHCTYHSFMRGTVVVKAGT